MTGAFDITGDALGMGRAPRDQVLAALVEAGERHYQDSARGPRETDVPRFAVRLLEQVNRAEVAAKS
jgi:hypothetical protein